MKVILHNKNSESENLTTGEFTHSARPLRLLAPAIPLNSAVRQFQALLMRQICGDAFGVGVMEATIGDTTFIQKSNTAGMSIYEFDRR